MVRRDFELIAGTISNLQGVGEQQREQIAMQFAVAIAPVNPMFDLPKFILWSTGKTLVP